MKTIIMALALAAVAGTPAAAAPAGTGTVIGGSSLLGEGMYGQLERWLGAGELDLTNVYTRRPGDTSADFHAGADGKGPTFTLLEVTNAGGATYLVGGYDPQSWASDEGWHETPRDSQRTAFLFNFTVPAVYRQVPSTFELPSQGQRQTFNELAFGPVFGSGPDLFVNDRLDVGLSWQLSYGNPNDDGRSIIDRGPGSATVRIDGMEVLAITPVPEPGACAMLLGGLGVLGGAAGLARKRGRHAQA
jgi:hypothetical protein